jgi:hypothetical protein
VEGFHASPRGGYVSFYDINEDKADALAAFFRILDRWDRERSDLSEGD